MHTYLRLSITCCESQGILTLCPSDAALAISLGPTNPGTTIVAPETLFFRRGGFSPPLWLLVPTFLLRNAPAWVTPLASMRCEHSPTAPSFRRKIKPSVSVLHLAPFICGAKSLDE